MQIKAKKSLGQNFLIDQNIIKKIVEAAEIKASDSILEVGPGTGNLTEYILKKNIKKFFVVEKDAKLVKILKDKFSDRINIINNDILNFQEDEILKEKVIVFGNLPYNISTQILSKWIIREYKKEWYKSLFLMFQKEVADRIIAKVNHKNYGRLSILSNWKLKVEKIMDISSSCFYPKPKVNSTLLKFTPKNNFFKIKNPKNLEIITRVFFNQKRKMIKKPFNQLFNNYSEIVKKLCINLNLRPQNISPEIFYKITKEYEDLRN